MMLLLLVVMGCGPTDADRLATIDEAACMWVDRCSDRYANVEECLAQTPAEPVLGCVIDTQAYGECVELLDTSTCPAGDLFVPPAQCEELWVCDDVVTSDGI